MKTHGKVRSLPEEEEPDTGEDKGDDEAHGSEHAEHEEPDKLVL